ncbi:hypothetical protein GUF45_26050, partial [Xanthomonas citri pv. citri]|nr:hypothetical protein [Xanthomonas citri pv. citri]
ELVEYLVKGHENKLRTALLKEKTKPAKNEAPLQTERTDPNKPFTFHTRRFVTEQEVTETQLANTEPLKIEKTSNLQ